MNRLFNTLCPVKALNYVVAHALACTAAHWRVSSKAFRLMALAVGVLPKVAKLVLPHMSQHFEHSWSDQGAV